MPCRRNHCEGCESCSEVRVEFRRSGTAMTDRFPEYGDYRIVSNGRNEERNYWEKRQYADPAHENKNTYYYNNKNGSLFWQYPDWQTRYINPVGEESWGISKDKPRDESTPLPTPPPSPERGSRSVNRSESNSNSSSSSSSGRSSPPALNQDGVIVHFNDRNLFRFRDRSSSPGPRLGPAFTLKKEEPEEHSDGNLFARMKKEVIVDLDASPLITPDTSPIRPQAQRKKRSRPLMPDVKREELEEEISVIRVKRVCIDLTEW